MELKHSTFRFSTNTLHFPFTTKCHSCNRSPHPSLPMRHIPQASRHSFDNRAESWEQIGNTHAVWLWRMTSLSRSFKIPWHLPRPNLLRIRGILGSVLPAYPDSYLSDILRSEAFRVLININIYIYKYICDLFNDAFRISDCIAPNGTSSHPHNHFYQDSF
jgi:hypothetical protein